MEVEVRNRLHRVLTAVRNDAVAVFGDAEFASQTANNGENMPDQRSVFRFDVVERTEFLFRDNENVNRRLRGDVVKRQAEIVFVNDRGRNFFIDNAFENSFFGHNALSRGVKPLAVEEKTRKNVGDRR